MLDLLTRDELDAVVLDAIQEAMGNDESMLVYPGQSLKEFSISQFLDVACIVHSIHRRLQAEIDGLLIHDIIFEGSTVPMVGTSGKYLPFNQDIHCQPNQRTIGDSLKKWGSMPFTVARLQDAVAEAYAVLLDEEVQPDMIYENGVRLK